MSCHFLTKCVSQFLIVPVIYGDHSVTGRIIFCSVILCVQCLLQCKGTLIHQREGKTSSVLGAVEKLILLITADVKRLSRIVYVAVQCQLIERNTFIQNGIFASPKIHVGDHVGIGHCVIITHIDHDLHARIIRRLKLLLLQIKYRLSGVCVLSVIISRQIISVILEGSTGTVLPCCRKQVVCHLLCQIRVEQEIGIQIIPLRKCNGTVLIELCPLLADQLGRISVGEETVQKTAVVSILGHSVQIYINSKFITCLDQLLQILLTSKGTDRFCPLQDFLLHAAVAPAGKLH